RTSVGNLLVFSISVAANGAVTLDQSRAVDHADPNDPNDTLTLGDEHLIQLTATITDRDGDAATRAALNIGKTLIFVDDAPVITAPFDADPVAPGVQSPEHLGYA